MCKTKYGMPPLAVNLHDSLSEHVGGLISRGLSEISCMLANSEVPLVVIDVAGRENYHARYNMIVSYTSISLTPRQCLFQATTRL